MREIRPLTSLRGLFACWVVLLHIFIGGMGDFSTESPFILRGYLAVDFFFFLSGFILAGTYGPGFLTVPSPRRYLRYVAHRIGRLFPLHVVIVLAIVALHPVYQLHRIIEELSLTQRWRIWPSEHADWINLPAWSISTEWAASLLFPVFVWAALKGSALRAAGAALLFTALLIFAAVDHQWNLNIWRSSVRILPLIRCFGDFGLGIVAFRYRDALPALKSDIVIASLALLFVLVMGLEGPDLLSVALIFPMVIGIAGNTGRVSTVLSTRPLHRLGMISYSIYLTHYSIVMLFARFLGDTPSAGMVAAYIAGAATVTLAVSLVTYRLIEMPVRRWIKNVADSALGDLPAPARPPPIR